MNKSLYKLPFVHKSLWRENVKKRNKTKKLPTDMVGLTVPQDINLGKNMYFFIRASFISKRLAKTNKIIGIYNGFAFLTMTLNKKMAGYRLGEFSGTRRTPKHKGKKAQKNKVKKKKK